MGLKDLLPFDKLSLIFLSIAFQFQLFCVATNGKYQDFRVNREFEDDTDDAIKAFLIISFFLYCAAFILAVLITFAGLENKIVKIITIVVAIVGVVFCFIGICIYAGIFDDKDLDLDSNDIPPFSFTTYLMGILLELAGAVFMIITMVM